MKAIHKSGYYLAINKPFIPNYGERYQDGETRATAFVESTIH